MQRDAGSTVVRSRLRRAVLLSLSLSLSLSLFWRRFEKRAKGANERYLYNMYAAASVYGTTSTGVYRAAPGSRAIEVSSTVFLYTRNRAHALLLPACTFPRARA